MAGACDFQVLEPWETPRWGVSLTMPLLNRTYNLGELVENDTTISHDTTTNELQIEFSGTLDTTKIDSSYLEVSLPSATARININEALDEGIDADDFFIEVSEEVRIVLKLDSLLRSFDPNNFGTLDFPSGTPVPIPELIWNSNIAGRALNSEEEFEVFDPALILQDNAFIQAVRYVQLSDTDTSEFATRVETPDFPTNVDSILISAISGSYFQVIHDTSTLPPDGDFYRVSNLQSDSLGSDLALALSMKLPTTTGDLLIPAGTDPMIEITISLTVGGLDSLAITTAQSSLIDEPPDPVSLPGEIQITEGKLREGVIAPINQISLGNLGTTLPFDLQFQLSFPNFDSLDTDGTSPLILGPYTLRDGEPLVSEEKSIAGYTFYNPSSDDPIAEFEYDLEVDILEKDVVLPLDGSPLGAFSVSLGIGLALDDPGGTAGDLHFESITGIFEISFDAVNTTIEDIPTGFTGFQFGRLSLSLLLRNQIDLPVALDLNLTGITFEGDTARIPINPALNYPSRPGAPASNGDTAYTLIVMDESSVRTYWLTEGGTDASSAWDSTVAGTGDGETIVDVLNLPPDIIEVAGAAEVQGQGVVEAGKGIWGSFELIAPFAFIMPLDISFLPAAPIPWGPMAEDARQQIQTALLSASLTSSAQTNFPIGGKISLLASDSNLFTLALDYLDDLAAGIPTVARTGDTTVYTTIQEVLAVDSILDVDHIVFYPESQKTTGNLDPQETKAKRVEFYTTTGDTFWIGHIFDMELPSPKTLNDRGWVTKGGDTTQVITLDAERVGWIASAEEMYLKTFITLYGSPGARTIQTSNSIHFAAFFTFNLASDIFQAAAEADTSDVGVLAVEDITVQLDSTARVDLDSVFVPPTGSEIKDLEISSTSNHSGVATTTLRTIRTGDGVQKLVLVKGIGLGTANITLSADDDPDDDTDPAEASFQVTVIDSIGPASVAGRPEILEQVNSQSSLKQLKSRSRFER
jgi:hypothetical protein